MTTRVVVDDSDSGINYRGPWFGVDTLAQNDTGSFASPWQETLHGTNGGGNITYSFSGMSRLLTNLPICFRALSVYHRFQERMLWFSGVTAHTKVIGPPIFRPGDVLSTIILPSSILMVHQLQMI